MSPTQQPAHQGAPGRGGRLPPWACRALGLLLLFVLAKAALLGLRARDHALGALRGAPPWALPWALLDQDACAALLWAGGELLLGRLGRAAAARWWERLLWLLYGGAALYTAANVPVARVFATPLTYPMVRAAGGALSDSLSVYVTAPNVLAVVPVLAGAAAAPPLLARVRPRAALAAALAVAVPALVLGPPGHGRLELRGLHRNALLALATTALSQRAGGQGEAPFAVAPLPPEGEAADLGHLRGATRGRSVLWVVLESTAAQYLRPWGAPDDPMPTVSALAGEGLVFESAYAAYPESIKGLFAELCATYPAAHTGAERYAGAAWPCDSVAERFRAAGYRTAMFHSGWFAYLGMEGVVRGRGFDVLEDAGVVGGRYATSFGVDEAAAVRRLLAFLDGLPPGAPWFVMYLPITGHHPYESPGPRDRPRPFGVGDDLSRYKNDLLLGDRALADLLAGLRRRGLWERTLLVLSGDHGEAFHQHEGNFAHTLHLYEENVHVPLLVAGGGLLPRPLRAPQVASVVDIAPTILDLCGLDAPPAYQGRSLLRGEPGVARFFTDHALFQLGLRQGRWKLIHDQESGRSRLYDLAADPGERQDLSAGQPGRAARYRDHLRNFFARQRALVTARE